MTAPAYSTTNTTARRPNKTHACPICGSRKAAKGCYWREDSGGWVMAYCATPSDKRAINSPVPGLYLHLNKDGHRFVDEMIELNRRIEQEKAAQPKSLAPRQIDEINRYFLAICPLLDKHLTYLQEEKVPSFACSTLKYSQAGRLAKELLKQFPKTAPLHPLMLEVIGKDGRKWWTIAGAADGLLFPATNVDGLILGIQIRKDKPKGKDDRYRWLSSGGKGGTPLAVFKAMEWSANPYMLIITEGFKKASRAAATWGCNAISLAGVNGYKEAELIRTITQLRVTNIVLAFDQDKHQNPSVKKAEKKLLATLAAALPTANYATLEWAIETGKGLDDALKAGSDFEFKLAGQRFVNGLDRSIISKAFGKARPLYTLQQARKLHRATIDRLLTNPTDERLVITSPTGTGKSKAADDALAETARYGKLANRWLLLAPNKANIAERTAPGTKLFDAIAAGLVVIQQGRNYVDVTQPFKPTPFDCANPAAHTAGAARQIAAKVVCKDCPFGSADNWDKAYPGQPRVFECEQIGYIASRQASEAALVVIATKDAYLNNSDMSDKFTGIICDEDLLPHLYEVINYSSETFTGWREAISLKNLAATTWERLMAVIELAFNKLATRKNLPAFEWLIESRPYLREAATQLYEDLDDLVYQCGLYGKNKEGAFDFERPYEHNSKKRFPFKGGVELLDALNPFTTNQAHFARCSDKSYKLVVYAPRAELINTLRSKTLVILDATLPLALKFYLPDLKETRFDVPQNIQIFQITDALYSKQDLFNPKTRERVGRATAAFAKGKKKHLTIVPQRFESGEQALPLPEGGQVEHWGMHKATNQYSDCDSLVLVGHHQRPVDYIKAELQAARNFAAVPVPKSNGPDRVLKLYNCLMEGVGAGRWMKCDQDPDVQTAIEQDYQANIIQALGRLRAACRSFDLPPAQVLILCNEPVGDLAITKLVTVKEIISNPPENETFIDNNFMKPSKNGGLVPAYTAAVTGLGALDETLTQDVTRENQLLEAIWGAFEELDYPLRH